MAIGTSHALLMPCHDSVSLLDQPGNEGQVVRELVEREVVVVLVSKKTFAEIQVFHSQERGWIEKTRLCVLFSPAFDASNTSPRYVRFTGPCGTGKSEFEKALKEKDSRDEWVIIDRDEVMFHVFAEAIRKAYPEEFSVIAKHVAPRDMFHAFVRDQICCGASTSASEEETVKELVRKRVREFDTTPVLKDWRSKNEYPEIRLRIVKMFETAVEQKKSILFFAETPTTRKMLRERFSDLPIISVFMYSPLVDLIKRVCENNHFADSHRDVTRKRFISFPFESYCALLKETPDPRFSCDSISRKGLKAAYEYVTGNPDRAWTKTDQERPPFSEYESSAEAIKKTMEGFFTASNGEDTCYVTPRENFDIILNNGSEATPKEMVATFLQALAQ